MKYFLNEFIIIHKDSTFYKKPEQTRFHNTGIDCNAKKHALEYLHFSNYGFLKERNF